MTNIRRAELAQVLLRGVRLDWMITERGIPSEKCLARIPTLSSGELVLVCLAFAIIDYGLFGAAPPSVDKLLLLDQGNLARVAAVLRGLAEDV